MPDRFVHESADKIEVLALNFPQQMDFNEFDKIIDALTHVVAAKPSAKWVIDLTHVEYTGSAILGLLVNLRQQVKESGGSLMLCCMSQRLSDILHACSLDRLFKTAPTRAAAMKAVG